MKLYPYLLLVAVACGGTDSDDDPPAGGADATVGGAPDATPVPGAPDATPGGGGGSPDAMPGGGGGGDPEAGVVQCNGAPCDVTGDDVCCITISGQTCKPAVECTDGFSAPQHCDGPEDCGTGQACCAVFEFGGDIGSFCRDECQTNMQGNEAELCHDTGDCSHAGETCNVCEFPGAPAQNACAGPDIDACN